MMGSDSKLEEYKAKTPTNREERRRELRKHGWYYVIHYGDAPGEWYVCKVSRSGKSVLFDDYSRYNTTVGDGQ